MLKISESKKSEVNTDEVYVPKLPWFSTADRFMNGVVISRTSKSNLVSLFLSVGKIGNQAYCIFVVSAPRVSIVQCI